MSMFNKLKQYLDLSIVSKLSLFSRSLDKGYS